MKELNRVYARIAILHNREQGDDWLWIQDSVSI